MKTNLFKKFFKHIATPFNWVKTIPTKIVSAKGWAVGIYTVFVQPFIKRLCAFINALVVPTVAKAK